MAQNIYAPLDDLEKELQALPPSHRIGFAACVCERMFPTYTAFYRMENWGNPSLLRIALDEIWQIAGGTPVDAARISQLIEVCESEDVIPDMDDFGCARYGGEAMFAACAILHTLDACPDPSPSHILKAVKIAFDTIDSAVYAEYYYSDNFPEDIYEILDKEVPSHPWMIRELSKQREDLEMLKNASQLDREFLERLRNSSSSDGKSLIDAG
jgi:uncharacterized protein YjaG (DUF416 family)